MTDWLTCVVWSSFCIKLTNCVEGANWRAAVDASLRPEGGSEGECEVRVRRPGRT